jgi:Tfp pilus assembly protein PilV
MNKRTGFILQEVLIAILIALAAMVGVAQLLAMVAQQRRLVQQRTVAVQEAGNLMEDFASRPWAEITAEKLADVRLSDACQRCLPDATLHVEVNSEDADSQRISIRIDWPTAAGSRGEPVRLVGWRFRDEEAGP